MKKDTQPPRGKSATRPSSAAKPPAEALPASAPARGRRWLMKCEPDAYTISDLQRDGTTTWEGVRNYQARNFMRDMKLGDRVLFYASNADPSGVTGIAEISREAFPDPFALKKGHAYYDPKATAEEPIWVSVELKFVEKFDEIVSLETLKNTKGLEEMVVTKKGSRLSIQPVTENEFEIVAKLGRR
jgi:predicted RNA-binding protein with PUA-like domain